MNILENFCNKIADGICQAIEKRIPMEVKVRVHEIKTIDELINIVEHTCFDNGRTVLIEYHRCKGYTLKLYDKEDKLVLEMDEPYRNMRSMYEELLEKMINEQGNIA